MGAERPPESALERARRVLDAGDQHSDEHGYGTWTDPENPWNARHDDPGKCARCQWQPLGESGDLCDGCRAFLLEDSTEDPAAPIVQARHATSGWASHSARLRVRSRYVPGPVRVMRLDDEGQPVAGATVNLGVWTGEEEALVIRPGTPLADAIDRIAASCGVSIAAVGQSLQLLAHDEIIREERRRTTERARQMAVGVDMADITGAVLYMRETAAAAGGHAQSFAQALAAQVNARRARDRDRSRQVAQDGRRLQRSRRGRGRT